MSTHAPQATKTADLAHMAPAARRERDYRRLQDAQHRVEQHAQEREARDDLVRAVVADGWTHAAVAEATGLTRGRINQIARGRR